MVSIINIHARLEVISEIANLVNADFKLRDGKIIEWSEGNPPTEEEIQTKLTELQNAEPMRLLREERNRRLAETDWWASSDLLISDDQRKYRQALRDITKTAEPKLDENGNLTNIDWPEKP